MLQMKLWIPSQIVFFSSSNGIKDKKKKKKETEATWVSKKDIGYKNLFTMFFDILMCK
jgi:hypothetical protein